jgi:hypothetical protein
MSVCGDFFTFAEAYLRSMEKWRASQSIFAYI